MTLDDGRRDVFSGYTDAVLIGEGGLGRVFRATRRSTGGLVAIKELREVPSASPAWHRAQRELEAMLRLKGHPYVVSVEEIIEGPAGPCLVMEYLDGGSLMGRVEHGPLTTAELLLVGQHVTQALGAAHEVGIVHRDVKPHNLLIGSFGQVKVADFGIAALNREAGLRTRTQAFTLAYASPEELDGEGDIGPGADAWSFAATMLHLATGRRPSFRERSMHNDLAEMEQRGPMILPVTAVLRRCFEVDPAARPRMAELNGVFNAAMAGLGSLGIARLGGAPTLPPGWMPPPPVMAPSEPDGDTIARPRASLATPVIERVGMTLPEGDHPDSVRAALRHGRRNLVIGAAVALVAIVVVAVVALTGGGDDPAGTGATGPGGSVSDEPLLSIDVGGGAVTWATFSPDGSTIAAASAGGTASVWDAETGASAGAPLTGHRGQVNSVEYSQDGSKIVTAGEDGYAIVFDARSGVALNALDGRGDPVRSARFSPDGRTVLLVSGHFARMVNLTSGQEVALREQPEGLLWGALDPNDGLLIVTAGRDNTAKFWTYPYADSSYDTGRQTGDIATAAFSADGRQVVTASVDGHAIVWNANTGTVVVALDVQSSRLWSAMFSPDGSQVIVADDDGTAKVFDARTGALVRTLTGHTGAVLSAAFSPDGAKIITAGEDGTILIWNA